MDGEKFVRNVVSHLQVKAYPTASKEYKAAIEKVPREMKVS
jgi:hypothetical protein